MSSTFEMEAVALALIALDECGGDSRKAIAELDSEPLGADERALADRAKALLRERLAR